MWLIVFAVSILSCIAGIVYLAGKTEKIGIFSHIEGRVISKALALLLVLVFIAILCFVFDLTNAIVIVIHVAVFLLAGDLVSSVVRKFVPSYDNRITDAVMLILCLLLFIAGWNLMHGMKETDYTLATDKKAGDIVVAHIADSHIGAGFDAEGFAKRLAVIEEKHPDILVLTGDFVDDSTTRDDMIGSCKALGDFKAKYGVYYCLGNHDMGYRNGGSRGFTGDEMLDELRKCGVNVLLDESVLVDDRFYVIGRLDAGYGQSKRAPLSQLIEDLDKSKYMIVLDHQPTDYEAEAATGVDLVLSGHTHGGQLFPLEYIQPLVSENDNVRGHEKINATDFIVTDGISDWAIKFRTGCASEYVLIDVKER